MVRKLMAVAICLGLSLPAMAGPLAQDRLRQAKTALEQSDKAKAQTLLEQAVAEDPSLAEAHFQLALLYWERLVAGPVPAVWPSAKPHYQAAVRLDPDNADYHYQFASALLVAGEHEAAETEFRRALHLSRAPGDATPAAMLASLVAPRDPLEAEALYRRAIRSRRAHGSRHFSRDTQLSIDLSRLLASQPQRQTDAEAVLREALTLVPGEPYASCELAGLLGRSGRMADAEAVLKESLQRHGADEAYGAMLNDQLAEIRRLKPAGR